MAVLPGIHADQRVLFLYSTGHPAAIEELGDRAAVAAGRIADSRGGGLFVIVYSPAGWRHVAGCGQGGYDPAIVAGHRGERIFVTVDQGEKEGGSEREKVSICRIVIYTSKKS